MKTADLDPRKVYATCEGQRLELVEPVHARWAKVASDGNKDHRFVELDDDALPGKRTDPWGKCHTRDQRAAVGVRVRLWVKDHIDRNGDVRDGHGNDYVEKVLEPADIAGTWRDYLVLHGTTVRRHADDFQEKRDTERYHDAALAAVAELVGGDLDSVSANTGYRRDPNVWRFGFDLTAEQVAMLVARFEVDA